MSILYSFSVVFFISLVTTISVVPWLIKHMQKRGFTGTDMNKISKAEIPEMGGIAVVIGFIVGVYSILFLGEFFDELSIFSNFYLASLITVIGIAFVGLLDDLLDMRQKTKAILPFIFALPLGIYASKTMYIPIIGDLDFGLWMFLIVPFGVTCAANSMNMLEGFNGLGASLGIVITLTMIILSLMNDQYEGLGLLFPLLGSLLGFLVFNKYPSKIFPGDTLTLFMGATIGCASILNDLRLEGIILLTPMIVEFFLKFKGSFKAQCFAEEIVNGVLIYRGNTESLTHLAMKSFPMNENGLVRIFVLFEMLIASVVIMLSHFNFI